MAEPETLDVEEENEPVGTHGPGATFTAWMYSHYFEFVREKAEK